MIRQEINKEEVDIPRELDDLNKIDDVVNSNNNPHMTKIRTF